MQNPSQPQVFLSQSECNEALSCPMRWWARWFLGMQPPDEEDRPRRVGSMGHAILSDDVQATWRGDTKSPYTAVHAEAEKRGWLSVEEDEYQCALAAAGHVMTDAEIGWSYKHVLPDLYSETGDDNGLRGPLAEVRLRARWAQVAHFFTDDRGMPSKAWADVMRCEAVRQRYSGIEGQPDLVSLSPDLTTAIVDDYKFRQKPDLGGAQVEPDLPVPDRQAAWYLALLHSVGLRPAGGLVFRQVNVYAGRWLTLDEFLDAARGQAKTVEQYRLVTDSGLPTRDTNRLAEAGGMVTAEVWAEAHRILAEDRLQRRLSDWRTPKYTPTGKVRKQGDPPDRLSTAEVEDARRFIADLEAYRPVVVRTFRADPLVCREVVRDMIVGVDAPLAQALRGMTPARHLQTYKTSPCMKPRGGCPIRVPCLGTIGTSNIATALKDMADQGALHKHGEGPRLAPAAPCLETT